MTLKKRLSYLNILLFFSLPFGCSQSVNPSTSEVVKNNVKEPIIESHFKENTKFDSTINWSELSEEEWKNRLNDQEYYVLREKGTERAFTGDLLNNKKTGIYICAGCNTPLYKSETKFKSGTGWPSFYDIIKGNVLSIPDNSYGMQRTEVVCATCKGHQGHVFNDGPNPTGLRYCINSVSIKFVEE